MSAPTSAAECELDLLYSEVEDDVRATVRDVLGDRCAPAAVTAMYDGDRAVVPGLWKALAVDLGLAGLLVPEEAGGAGASAREAAVVLEELGRAVAPTPFLTSSVVATTVLLDADSELLAALASGERVAALAVALSTGPDGPLPDLDIEADGTISGTVTSVAGALEADVLLVPAGGALYVVPVGAAQVAPVVSLDMSRQLADVTFHATPGERLSLRRGVGAEHAIRRGLRAGAALLASEQLGLARWCLEETVSYLKVRRQFGRVVGGFQAVKHRLADLSIAVESGTAAARHAAVALATRNGDVPVATSLAQAFCGDLAVYAAEEAVQLHGGIGMTWEHPAHLYLKRAKADQIAYGTPGAHRARLAELVDLPAPGDA